MNTNLIAKFFEVDRQGKRLNEAVTVLAPLTECSLDVSLNWQSPFEGKSLESAAPTAFQMLQSGAFQPTVDAFAKLTGSSGDSATGVLQQFVGRTGITKLNSVQVFVGMQPVKIQATAIFRAWRDTFEEVERPSDQIMAWALPAELARDSSLLGNAVDAVKGKKSPIEALLPSKSPSLIAMTYKGRNYYPLVIENVTYPLGGPITKDGNLVELSLGLTLCSLAALDRNDWKAMRKK
ncbi:MAG: hypothetical protein PHE55_00850 [Methylococcaceae bacterium]|nr:hypothetical protein [Methylococcaceae bacterium]